MLKKYVEILHHLNNRLRKSKKRVYNDKIIHAFELETHYQELKFATLGKNNSPDGKTPQQANNGNAG